VTGRAARAFDRAAARALRGAWGVADVDDSAFICVRQEFERTPIFRGEYNEAIEKTHRFECS